MFFKKKKDNSIMVTLTKTSQDIYNENRYQAELHSSQCWCPECGSFSSDQNPFGRMDENGSVLDGKCNMCGAEWEVRY